MAASHSLPDFPASARAIPALSDGLTAAAISLRAAHRGDMPFLSQLYAGMRAPEFVGMPWSARERAEFCDSQFALQHAHYLRHSPRSDFWIVEQAGVPIGRLYAERRRKTWRLLDMILAVEAQGRGIGSALIEWAQASAVAAGAESVELSVAINNPRAQSLYRRNGFIECGDNGPMHIAMEWRPGAAEAAIRR